MCAAIAPGMWFKGARFVLAGFAIAACHPYEQGSITRTPDGLVGANAAELHCIDVAVHPLARERAESVSSIHVVYQFGNHCDETAVLNFAAPVVEAQLSDGRRETLEPAPVEGERLSATIDAYAQGAENIGYLASPVDDAQHAIVAFCVDASRLEAGVKGAGRPACFERLHHGVFASVDASSLDEIHDGDAPPGAVATIEPSSRTTDDGGLTCTSSVAGPAWCDRFGVWSRPPPLTFGMGLSTHHFDLSHRAMFGGESYGAPTSLPAAPLGWLQAETFDLTVGDFLYWPFYLGAEAQIGGVSIGHAATLNDAPHLGVDSGGLVVGAGVTLGLESPRLGPFSAQLEIYGGGMVSYLGADSASVYTVDCSDGCDGPNVASWILEPRLRAHAWLTPWISLDGWGGIGLVPGTGDWSGGLSITLHARSFDGSP